MDKLIIFFRRLVPKPLRPLYDRLSGSESGLYIVFGGLTTVVSYLSYTLCAKLFGIDFMISEVISWICSVLFAFVTNKKYVFKSSVSGAAGVAREFTGFVFSRLFSLGADLAIMWVAVELCNINDIVAKIIASVFVLVINYIASKLLVFRSKK